MNAIPAPSAVTSFPSCIPNLLYRLLDFVYWLLDTLYRTVNLDLSAATLQYLQSEDQAY